VNTIKSQIGRHSVALISLLVALSSLAYNTWRKNWSGLGSDNLAASSISDSIDRTSASVLTVLAALD
jgi:hypothetical protein